jgi:O-antigen/teichoic acid export membrane protein/glycosyltransferase involved in cell wall biosynthesis
VSGVPATSSSTVKIFETQVTMPVRLIFIGSWKSPLARRRFELVRDTVGAEAAFFFDPWTRAPRPEPAYITKFPTMNRWLRLVLQFGWMCVFIRRQRINVLHFHYVNQLLYNFLPGRVRVIATPQGSEINQLCRGIHKVCVQALLRRAVTVTAKSPVMARRCVELGAAPAKVVDLNWGVADHFFAPAAPLTGPLRVLSMRATDTLYNIDTVFAATARAKGAAPLTLTYVKFNHNPAVALDESACDQILPPLDADGVLRELQAHDVLLSVPSFDGFATSIMEALASGAYPVISDIDAYKGWLEDRPDLLAKVPPRDVGALGALLIKLAGRVDVLRAERRGRQEYAASQFGLAGQMARLKEVYAARPKRGLSAVRAGFKKLAGSGFIRDTMKLFVGATLARLIGLALTPLIGRLYSPAAFGAYSVFTNYISWLALACTLRYELLFHSLRSNRMLLALFGLLTGSALLVATAATAVVAVLALCGMAMPIMMVMPLVAFTSALYILSSNFFIRKKLFKVLAAAGFLSAVTAPLAHVAFGLVLPSEVGLVSGYVTAEAVTTTFLVLVALRFRHFWPDRVGLKAAFSLARSQLDLPLKTLPQKFLSEFHSFFFIPLLAALYSDAVVGGTAMAMKLLTVPATLILQSVTNVSLQRLSHIGEPAAQLRFLRTLQLRLGALAALPFALVALFSEPIVGILLGPKWVSAHIYLRLLAPFYLLQMVCHPLINMFYVNRWNDQILRIELVKAILLAAGLLIGSRLFSLNVTLALYFALSGVGYYLIYRSLSRLVYARPPA